MSAKIKAWERRVAEMQQCNRVSDLVARYGEPHHKNLETGFEIWHYPLGVESRMLYSVHVAVRPDESCQAFMFFEPTDLGDTPADRSELSESVRRGASNAFRFFGRFIGR